MYEDVTTRGNYYPDKAMATAAVSISPFGPSPAMLTNYPLHLEPTALLAYYQYHEGWSREGSQRN